MTTLSHSNIWLHRMLTDQGACSHEHEPDSFEDVGDAENGPDLQGGPAYDRYWSESHEFIIDQSGTIVYSEVIDWGLWRFAESMLANHIDQGGDDPREHYKRKREAGEDWLVTFTDEDGPWYALGGSCWTSDPAEAGFFRRAHALQIAKAHDHGPHDRIVGKAKLVDRRTYRSPAEARDVLFEAGYDWDNEYQRGRFVNPKTGESAKIMPEPSDHSRYFILWHGRPR